MLARSFNRASKSTIDASVGVQEFVDAIRDTTRNFYRAPKVLATSTFVDALLRTRECVNSDRVGEFVLRPIFAFLLAHSPVLTLKWTPIFRQ